MLVLRRGTKVEAFSKRVADGGAWVCAEVIASNWYTCTVKYAEIVETLPRMATRPCPPPLEVEADLLPGDVVEFHDSFSWKTATFLKAVTENDFLIRLLGESVSFVVNKSSLRLRQSWAGGRWYFLGNKSITRNRERRMYSCAKRKQCTNCSPIKKNTKAQRRRLEDKPPVILDEDRESPESSVGSFSPGREVVHDYSITSRREGNDSDSSDAESSYTGM